jgi:hypothetical protein
LPHQPLFDFVAQPDIPAHLRVLSLLLPNGVRLLAPQSEPELSRWKAALERDRGLMRERANRRALQAALQRCGLACEEAQLALVCVKDQQLSTERAERVVGWAVAARLRRGNLPVVPAQAAQASAAPAAAALTAVSAAAAAPAVFDAAAAPAAEAAQAESGSNAPQQQAAEQQQGSQSRQVQQPAPAAAAAAAAAQADLSLLDISAADLEAGGRQGRSAGWRFSTCKHFAHCLTCCSLWCLKPWQLPALHHHFCTPTHILFQAWPCSKRWRRRPPRLPARWPICRCARQRCTWGDGGPGSLKLLPHSACGPKACEAA